MDSVRAGKLKKRSGGRDHRIPFKQTEFLKLPDLYEDDDLLKGGIDSWDRLLKVRTGPSKGKKAKVLDSQENVFIDLSVSFVNEYEFLDYQIIQTQRTRQQKNLARLLGRVENFKGFPHTEYYITAKDEGNFLILYKVAEPDKIPYDELFMARRLGDLLAVPLVGYPIEYCHAVPVLNSFNEKTSKYRPLCEGVSKERQAAYIRLKEDEKKVFKYLPKPNLFPRDFFSGQWFYVRTDLRAPNTDEELDENEFQAAQLVEFHPTLEHLDVLDSGLYNLKSDDKTTALFIPVKRVDYEMHKDLESLDPSFSERLKKGHGTGRPYFAIQFGRLIEKESGVFWGVQEEIGGRSLGPVVVTKNYFSFDIEIHPKAKAPYTLRYAFRRTGKSWDYSRREKRWFEDDSVLFFPTSKVKGKYYHDAADHSRADENRFLRLARFDPKQREIKWYFSTSTSKEKWIRDLGREAVFLLNRAFREAAKASGDRIKVILDKEGKDKEVGDIRYNVLNLMLTESDAGEKLLVSWFGRVLSDNSPETGSLISRGYNVANPVTGEVISAAANVWINDILRDYIIIIRQYIRFQVYPPAWKLNPKSPGVTDFLHKKIHSACPDVRDFIKDNRNRRFDLDNPKLDDKSFIKSCAKSLARTRILQSILHNMLKSFGQNPVLSASVDIENFYKDSDEIKKIFGSHVSVETSEKDLHPDSPQYSSVMDIVDIEHPILAAPGKLDIAALRFIYFNQVELTKAAAHRIRADCETEGSTAASAMCVRPTDSGNISCMEDGRCFLKIPSGVNPDSQSSQKSILEAARTEGLTQEDIKAYRVCGWDRTDPLCGEGDYGASPLEVVTNKITQTDNRIMNMRNRYDSDDIPEAQYPFKDRGDDFYNRWKNYRDKFLKGRGRTLLDYSFLNPEHRKEYKRILEEEARRNPEFKSYYDIREPVFNYFYKMAFLPVKHCVYKSSDNTYHAVALENIEEEIDYTEYPEDARDPFISCESPVVQKQAEKDNRGYLIAEVGFFGKDRKYRLRPNEKDKLDEKSAFESIFFYLLNYQFVPREPDLMAKYYRSMREYLLNGLDLNPYIDIQKDPDIPRDEIGYPNLPRVLSHKIDKKTRQKVKEKLKVKGGSVYERRQNPIKAYVEALRNHHTDEASRRLLSTHFDYQSIELEDLEDYKDVVEKNPQLYKGASPFLVQAYEEYTDSVDKGLLDNSSFVKFLQRHPATLSRPNNFQLLIPFVDEEGSLMAQLFRRFNESSDCIQKHSEQSPCESREDKQVFMEFVLDFY